MSERHQTSVSESLEGKKKYLKFRMTKRVLNIVLILALYEFFRPRDGFSGAFIFLGLAITYVIAFMEQAYQLYRLARRTDQ